MAKGSLSSLNIQLYTLGFVMGRVGISTQLTPVCFSAACDCNGRSQECYFDPELYRPLREVQGQLLPPRERGGLPALQLQPRG